MIPSLRTLPQGAGTVGLVWTGLITIVMLVGPIRAQGQPCFPDVAVPPWVSGDLELNTPGTSRPLPMRVGGDYELCSDGEGFGSKEDHYHYLMQRYARGSIFEVALVSIDESGMAGVAARWDERTPDAAYVRITVHTGVDGDIELRSAARLNNQSSAQVSPAPVRVNLPVWLRIERTGSTFTTSYSENGTTFTDHLIVDAADKDLDRGFLTAGMVQGSESPGQFHRAVFDNPQFVLPDEPPPDPDGCVEGFVIPINGGTEVQLRGRNLDSIHKVKLAGIPAKILDQSSRSLTLKATPLTSSHKLIETSGNGTTDSWPDEARSGDVVIESAYGEQSIGTKVIYAGRPFVRGDINEDGKVNFVDMIQLMKALFDREPGLTCREAADVNADRLIDMEDFVTLSQFIVLGKPKPQAPFPTPGLAPNGGFSCGLPEGPVISRIRSSATLDRLPTSSSSGRTLQVVEGDEIVLEGSGFPKDPRRIRVRFGSIGTDILPGSGPSKLRLRIREVPQGGIHCPVIFQDLEWGTPFPYEVVQRNDLTRFGVAHALSSEQDSGHLCPEFLPSKLDGVNVGYLMEDGVSHFLPIDPYTWDPTQPLRVEVNLPLPTVNGISRGAREISFFFYENPTKILTKASSGISRSSPTPPDYEAWLGKLAARIHRELNGGHSSDCTCDAQAKPGNGGVVISPCEPVIGWHDPGSTCCDPPPEEGVKLKAPPPPVWNSTTYKLPQLTCSEPVDFDDHPRKFAWCAFEKVIRESQGTGLPIWESYIPITNVLGGPLGIIDSKHPNNRMTGEKSIMVSTDTFYEAFEHGYTNPCAAAARRFYCTAEGQSEWMPAFSKAQRVVKTFWRTDDELPPSITPGVDTYSYTDPEGIRQNLVGMHLAISTGEIFSYWQWATFFVPKLVTENVPSWHDACSVGAKADQPEEIPGVWKNYFMCVEGAAGEKRCGNPWGPKNECKTQSCNDCHVNVGQIYINDDELAHPTLATAWLPSLANGEILSCYNDIKEAFEEDGTELFKHLAPSECLE